MAWDESNKDEAIDLILDCISSGKSLKSIIDERSRDEVPSYSTFMLWLNESTELSDRYARACEERAEKIFEEIIEIADDKSQDDIITDKGIIPNSEWIARSRLRVDARKWAVSKMNPKKFGDKIQTEHSGEIKTNSEFDLSQCSTEELLLLQKIQARNKKPE